MGGNHFGDRDPNSGCGHSNKRVLASPNTLTQSNIDKVLTRTSTHTEGSFGGRQHFPVCSRRWLLVAIVTPVILFLFSGPSCFFFQISKGATSLDKKKKKTPKNRWIHCQIFLCSRPLPAFICFITITDRSHRCYRHHCSVHVTMCIYLNNYWPYIVMTAIIVIIVPPYAYVMTIIDHSHCHYRCHCNYCADLFSVDDDDQHASLADHRS